MPSIEQILRENGLGEPQQAGREGGAAQGNPQQTAAKRSGSRRGTARSFMKTSVRRPSRMASRKGGDAPADHADHAELKGSPRSPQGFGLRQSSGAFASPESEKRQRTAAVQNAPRLRTRLPRSVGTLSPEGKAPTCAWENSAAHSRATASDFVHRGPNLLQHPRRNAAQPLAEKPFVQDAQLKHQRHRRMPQMVLGIGFDENRARKTKGVQLCREWND